MDFILVQTISMIFLIWISLVLHTNYNCLVIWPENFLDVIKFLIPGQGEGNVIDTVAKVRISWYACNRKLTQSAQQVFEGITLYEYQALSEILDKGFLLKRPK